MTLVLLELLVNKFVADTSRHGINKLEKENERRMIKILVNIYPLAGFENIIRNVARTKGKLDARSEIKSNSSF